MLLTSATQPVEEMLHGVCVKDPYRWLEDRFLPETSAWICEQDRRSNEYFSECRDMEAIRSRVRAYLDVAVFDQPARVASRYFYRRRDKGEEQAKIYMRPVGSGQERVLVQASEDPLLSARIYRISDDASLLAYEMRHGGSDQRTIKVLKVEDGAEVDTNVDADWFRGLVFDKGGQGFFYCQDTLGVAKVHTIRWHPFNTDATDLTCFSTPISADSQLLLTSDEDRLGAIHIVRDDSGGLLDFWITEHQNPFQWKRIFRDRSFPFHPMLQRGRIFARVDKDRYAEFDENGEELRTIVPQAPGESCRVVIAHDEFIVQRFDQMKTTIQRWGLNGDDLGTLAFPPDGTVQLLSPLASMQESLFYTWESFQHPQAIFELNHSNGQAQTWHQPPPPPKSTIANVRFSSYDSSDHCSIPITTVSPRKEVTNVPMPYVMTAYGGFGVPGTPQFSVFVNVMLECGVGFALPHIRGGGDFGKEWHEAARTQKRQTSFDDFLGAAEWLCDSGRSASDKLAIFGGSNSGLLVGAAITQRPDLFAAALCIAPLLDMVRYEHFDRAARWRDEYGTASDLEDFLALYAYSPYHRVQEAVNYPATLFVTGDRDDRCNPAHVRKMAAALQSRDAQLSPVLVDYTEARGHTPVLPLTIRIDSLAKRIAFLLRELRVSPSFGVHCETPRA